MSVQRERNETQLKLTALNKTEREPSYKDLIMEKVGVPGYS